MGIELNIDRLLKKFKDIGGNVNDILKQGISAGCLLVERDAKLNVKTSTGVLRESINHELEVNDDKVVGVIGTNVKYAPYVELGTGPVGQANQPDIAAKLNIKYRDSQWVYFSEEMQQFFTTKGQAGQPYLYPALTQNKQQIKEVIALAVKKAIEKMGVK